MRGLIMGRFQPFHLGHLELVRQALGECNDLIVAVTSSQFNYLKEDPFTAGERIEMIHNSLAEAGINPSRWMVLGIENQHNVATWASYLRAALPRFDRVYSGNPYVAMLLADSAISVVQPKFLDRERFNATSIRRMISDGEAWQEMVPAAVARVIESIRGEHRVRTILGSDTDPTDH